MTAEQVEELIHAQIANGPTTINHHGVTLAQILVTPQIIPVIARSVKDGQIEDEKLNAWLVGHERSGDGYRIIMRDDGLQFGLAGSGFTNDDELVLIAWYGDLVYTFLSM